MAKGYIKIIKDRCKGCEMCLSACPRGLITFPMKTLNRAGYYLAEYVDPEGQCIACQMCAIACPDCAIVVYKKEKDPVPAGGEK